MTNILLVNDDQDLCHLIERALKKEDFQVTFCYERQMAIQAFQQQKFQLVILDIMLPYDPIYFYIGISSIGVSALIGTLLSIHCFNRQDL